MTHRVYKEKALNKLFKIDIRHQKPKTNTKELGHISLTLLRFFLSKENQAIDLKAEMTSRTRNSTAKQQKSLKSLKKSIPRSQVVRIIDGDNELKKTRCPQ